MKILKWILIVVGAIIALLLIVSAFLPSERNYSNTIEIEKSPRLIFNQVNSLQNWENWSPFQEADSDMISEYFGPEQGVGNRQEWKSKVNGNGSMEILKSVNEHEVVYSLNLGMGNVDTTWFSIERNPKNVSVTWGTKVSNLGYPMGRLMMAIFDSQMSETFEKGLNNLKNYLDKQPVDCISGDVVAEDVPARSILGVSGKVTSEAIESFLGEAYGIIMGVIEKNKLSVTGVPIAIWEGDETTTEWGVVAALPVSKFPTKLPDGVQKNDLPQTKAVSILHAGPYQTASDSYYIILDYIMQNGLEITGNSWEEYLTDPKKVENPLHIQTKIVFPIK